MSDEDRSRIALSVAVAVLMGSQSVLGLSLPGEYRDVEWIRATWFGNDWVTLILSLPLLGISLVLARRGAVRGQVLGLGMLGHSTYNYGFYLFVAALNAFFPLYAILLVLSVVPQLRIAPIPLRCWDFGPGRSPDVASCWPASRRSAGGATSTRRSLGRGQRAARRSGSASTRPAARREDVRRSVRGQSAGPDGPNGPRLLRCGTHLAAQQPGIR